MTLPTISQYAPRHIPTLRYQSAEAFLPPSVASMTMTQKRFNTHINIRCLPEESQGMGLWFRRLREKLVFQQTMMSANGLLSPQSIVAGAQHGGVSASSLTWTINFVVFRSLAEVGSATYLGILHGHGGDRLLRGSVLRLLRYSQPIHNLFTTLFTTLFTIYSQPIFPLEK